ncbi:MAG: hypothetical protein KTR35_20085 [Gammaproteobacteria bacterium]|nr:hypothetical protein [Gammaproteobacteria bacterium]
MSTLTKAVSFLNRLPRHGLIVLVFIGGGVLTSCATPVGEVQRWSISGVEVAEFSGEVVDILCEVSGNCVEQCGGGERQIGIKTDTETILVSKDLNLYTGGAEQLWRFCGSNLVVNGQFTQSGNVRFFQVQNIKEPDGEWQSATQFLETWAEKNGTTVSAAKRWYQQDERVTTILERDGRLGLGAEADDEYFNN